MVTMSMNPEVWCCPICLCDDTRSKSYLECEHAFHAVCLGKYIANRKRQGLGVTCPMCRRHQVRPTEKIFNNVVRYGTVEDMSECTVDGTELHRTCSWGVSPLHVAASEGHMKKVAYLVRAGANVNVQANYGHTPLYLAALNGHLLVVKYLVNHGADIHLSRQGKTPMRIAIDTGEVAVADYLYQVYQVSLRANSTQYEPVLRLPKLRI